MNEPVTLLTSPALATPAIPAYQYTFGANPVATLVTANPLLCGNTAPATGTNPAGITTVYYSANGSTGATPKPFVFGASAATPTTSAIAYGATDIVYNGNVRFGGDPLDALVCYGLDANGVHKVTRDLFADGFEDPASQGLLANSTVTLSVLRAPGTNGYSGNEYDYYVDAFVPDMTNCGSLDCNFVLMEGYDTSLFNTGSGQWCKDDGSNSANPGQCTGSWNSGDINLQTTTGTTRLVAGHNYFAVRRFTLSGINTLPSAPVAVAALFSPLDLLENKLDDNVAVGNNTLANAAPSVVGDSSYTALVNAVAALQENTDSNTLTFDISDADSAESAGNLLHAGVTLNLPNGISVPVTPDCGSAAPITTTPVNRTCTIDIPLNNATFWDAAVAGQYQGQFDDVATDLTNGVYAPGISASIQIVAVDAQGKNSAAVSTPVHIFSTKNDAPTVTTDAGQLPPLQDPNDGNNLYPTYSCSIGAGNCGATFNIVTLSNSVAALAGPVAAFDELAAQTTAVNDLQCGADGGAAQVAFANAPVIAPHLLSQTEYDIAFQFATPLAAASSLCTLTMTDVEIPAFQNSESAATTALTFRIVVNP